MAAKHISNKKQDIVFLNIVFCLIVIFIHISSEIVLKMDRGHTLYWTVYTLSRLSSFVVQGFIMLSGAKLFLKVGNLRYGKFYLSRLTSIVLPYVVWVVIYYLYFCSRNYFVFSWNELLRFILVGDLAAHFYFIVILVQFYLLMPVWVLLFKKANPCVALVVTLMISIISNTCLGDIIQLAFPSADISYINVFFSKYLFYWTAGCMIGLHYQEFQNYLKKHWITITLFYVVCAVLNSWLSIVMIDNKVYWLELIHMLYIISALLFFYMLAQMFIAGDAVLLKPIGWLNSITFDIYLIHCLVIFITEEFLDIFGIYSYSARFGWKALAAYVGSVVLCMLWKITRNTLARLIRDKD